MNNQQEYKEFKFANLWYDIYKYRRLYYIILPIAFVLSCAFYLSKPNYYTCKVVLSPEMNSSLRYNSIRILANSFESLLGNMGFDNKGDALTPVLYPILMNSAEFKLSLLPIRIKLGDSGKEVTYYDYLLNYSKRPWWSGLFGKKVKPTSIDIFRPNRVQADLISSLNSMITCEIDKKTLEITISVIDTDPYVSAVIADSVKERLQQYITDYRTNKSRLDLYYDRQVCEDTRTKFDQARVAYANFSDANRDANLKSILIKKEYLEGEMELYNKLYDEQFKKVSKSEADVQKDVPAFITLQSATVPVEKTGPVRSKKVLIFTAIVAIVLTLYIFYKEGDLISLLLYEEK